MGRGFPAVVLGLLAGTLACPSPSFAPAATPGGTRIQNVANLAYGPVNSSYSLLSGQTTVTVVNPADVWSPFRKSVEPTGQVAPGFTLRYTNTFGNAGAVPLTNVTITDNLAANLIYVNGSATLPRAASRRIRRLRPRHAQDHLDDPLGSPGIQRGDRFPGDRGSRDPSDTTIPNTIGGTSDQTTDPITTNRVTTVAVEQTLRISMTASGARRRSAIPSCSSSGWRTRAKR